jgi:hypothetical protein
VGGAAGGIAAGGAAAGGGADEGAAGIGAVVALGAGGEALVAGAVPCAQEALAMPAISNAKHEERWRV